MIDIRTASHLRQVLIGVFYRQDNLNDLTTMLAEKLCADVELDQDDYLSIKIKMKKAIIKKERIDVTDLNSIYPIIESVFKAFFSKYSIQIQNELAKFIELSGFQPGEPEDIHITTLMNYTTMMFSLTVTGPTVIQIKL